MSLSGKSVRLRAVEPCDLNLMYEWENDPAVWGVSGTTAPFSRHTLERFIENQKYDISQTRQQRLIIEDLSGKPVGILDLFEYDLLNGRAGVGILIHDQEQRGKGYATDALAVVCDYVRNVLRLHQLWCGVAADNEPSLALFRSAGFCQTGIRRDWNWNNDGYIDEIQMQKIL